MSSITTRGTAALAVAAALLVAPGVAFAAPSPSLSDADRVGGAAHFVATTLAAGGDHYVYPGGSYFDGGNTIDAILGLAGADQGMTQAEASLAYLDTNIEDYLGTAYGDFSGSIAKTLIAVDAMGADPTNFGGHDLVADLAAREGADGHFTDAPDDYSITITQALAMIATLRATGATSPESATYLLAQQCDDGGFSDELDVATCVSDPDATAFALQALAGAPEATDADINDAIDYLIGRMVNPGGTAPADFGIRGSDGTANANTSGVAAQAFALLGVDEAYDRVIQFLASLQYGCSDAAALRGGFAYSAATRTTGKQPADSDLRATPQALLGFAGDSLLTVTSEGDDAGTTALPCTTASPTPTSTPTSTPTQTATASASATPTATATQSSGSTSTSTQAPSTTAAATSTSTTATGALASTGASPLRPVLIGLLLLLLGAAAVFIARRPRGNHA